MSKEDLSADEQNQTGKKLWGGRFEEATDAFVETFTASVTFDQRLAAVDIQGSLAHAQMLASIDVLSEEEWSQIKDGLNAILEEINLGQFEWSVAKEDVHMNIESRLIEKIGDVGKKLHTGRSRNDQVATDIRLYLRHGIDLILNQLLRLQKGLLLLAEKEVDTIMPGFTHLQIAQPISFGHHLMAWLEMLVRDEQRFKEVRIRVNQCPLGAAALAGTTYPIDRLMVAKLLGFDGVCENALDAVSDRDFAIDFVSAASVLMMHMSRFSEELIIWTSTQFNFVELPDRFCTGSSIMPQKKNPDVPELVRGKSGRVFGDLVNLLTLMKGQPLAYNKDNQEDKEPLFDTYDTVINSLTAFADMIPAIIPNREVMYQAAEQGFSTATDLADYLVKKGVSFRDAHEVVGKAVSIAVKQQKKLTELSLEALKKLSPLIEEDVYQVLTLEGSVSARAHRGGTAPKAVLDNILRHKQRLK